MTVLSATNKYALIVGINKYPHMGAKFQLRGCVNDAKLIRNTLINKFSFERKHITELFDERATREGIRKAMADLVDRVGKNDIVVFHYSGHGHRCKTKTEFTDEGSGKDNCILPHDDSKPKANGKPDYREIRDNEINNWLQDLTKKTSNVTLIFDACHSGTITRGTNPQAQARSIPESIRRQPAPSTRPNKANLRSKKGAGGWLTLNKKYVVISGCRDMQTSKERWFREGDTQYRHGVLTYCLIKALNNAKPGSTYRDIFETVCSLVPASAADQNPQIEGQIDRELFGVKDIESGIYLPITAVNGKTIRIEGGAAHGLRQGTKWRIYPPGTKVTDGIKPIAIATISTVGATSSKASLAKENQNVTVACRCVAQDIGNLASPLLVNLSDVTNIHTTSIGSAIDKRKLLKLSAQKRGADIQGKLLGPKNKAAKDFLGRFPAYTTILKGSPCWAFSYDDGSLAFPLHSVKERNVANIIVSNLEKIAKFRRVLALNNSISDLKVSFNLFHRSKSDKLTLANGGAIEFKEGDGIVLEIINNEKERPIFFSIIWLSADKAIDHFYPPQKISEELSPGKTIRIGHGSRRLHAALSPHLTGEIGVETCKIMITTSQSDFSWLSQGGTRSNKQSSTSIKEFDIALRGSNSKVPSKAKDDWLSINRSMTILRTKPMKPRAS